MLMKSFLPGRPDKIDEKAQIATNFKFLLTRITLDMMSTLKVSSMTVAAAGEDEAVDDEGLEGTVTIKLNESEDGLLRVCT